MLGSLALAALLLAPTFQDPAARSSTGTLVVLNKSDATASLIDPTTGETRALLATGAGPHEVAVSADGRLAVVADYGQRQPGRTLTVIDVVAGKVLKTIDLVDFERPHGLAFLPGTMDLLVTAERQQALVLVDVEKGDVVSVMPTESDASHMVAVTPNGERAFVANIASGTLSAIDVTEGELLKNIPTGAGCEGVDVHPDGKEVWTSNRAADTLSVIDTESLEVLAQISTGSFPIRVKFTPDGARALVSCANGDEVWVLDAKTRELVAKIPMQYEPGEKSAERLFGPRMADKALPIGIQMQADGKRAYVANANANLIAVVDLEKLVVVGTIRAGTEPDGMGWSQL